MSHGVDDDQHELPDAGQPLLSHIQDSVQVVVVEGIPVRIPHKLLVHRNLLRDEERHRRVAAMYGDESDHEATEAVCYKGAWRELVEVNGYEFLVVGPFIILLVSEDFC